MAEGILGLGTGQSTALNQELIDRLKEAERKAQVEPLETSLEDIDAEREIYNTISAKVDEVLDSIKPFDLFITGGATAFDQKAATTSGDSVTFNATDVSKLNNGVTTVNIDTLAQKDVYQSNAITGAQKDALGDIGVLTIAVGSESFDFNTADYATYDELATAINAETGVAASLDQVGTDSYRLILKSEDSGLDNALTISGTAADDLGYTTDEVGTINAANHTLTAQDMKAFIDGIEYNVSSNTLIVDGLTITANKTGESTINISDDNTQVVSQVEEFITQYNELVTLVEEELSKDDSPISDRSTLRDILAQVKDKIFGEYGAGDDQSIFNYGFELDRTGYLSLNTTTFSDALENNLDDIKDLFVGTAAKEGMGTQLKALFDEMKFSDGLLGIYDDSITSRKETLQDELKDAEETLDDKYSQLAQQFASYTAIITQFESSFSGLNMIIQQSTASN